MFQLQCLYFSATHSEDENKKGGFTEASLTCEPERAHALELRLLQPFPHAAEGLSAGLELGPGFGVPQQVGQGPLGPAQDPLGKDGLRDAVALQLRGDPLRHLFGIHLLHLAPRNTTPSTAAPLLPGPGGLLPAVPQPLAMPLRAKVGVRVVVEAVDLYHARRGAHVLLRVSAEHGRVVSLEPAGGEHLLTRHGGTGMSVGRDAGLGRVYAGQTGAGQRGEALAHAGILVMICGIQTVHRRQTPVLAHQREAAADISGDPLVRVRVRMMGMGVVVVMMGRKLVGHGGDGG